MRFTFLPSYLSPSRTGALSTAARVNLKTPRCRRRCRRAHQRKTSHSEPRREERSGPGYACAVGVLGSSEAWHYPPELIELVVDAVARLNRGKGQEIDFFRGAGVPEAYLRDLAMRVTSGEQITKFEIARTVLVRLNEAGDQMIRPRREILNRIVKTETFDHCWPDDRLAALGAVAAIRKAIHERDAFTRMEAEKNRERAERLQKRQAELERRERLRRQREEIRSDLARLFSESDPWRRGKELEKVLNRLFALDGMSVKESFRLVGDAGEGTVEQIDGVVVIDGEIYLVEAKWLKEPAGVDEIAPHFVRVFSRDAARGIFISASGFSAPAIKQSVDALSKMVSVLCELEEIVKLLDSIDASACDYFRAKVHAAITERRPLHRPLIT
jgi:restriction system protein